MMLSQRAQALKPSPTLALAAKAKELAAQGYDVISLSVGEPDWDTFDHVKAAGIEALRKGLTKYTPAAGLPEFRATIAEVEGPTLGLKYKPSEVTVSPGGKFTIFAAFQVLLNPGDEVLIPAPYWVSYPPMAELAGAKPVILFTDASSGFKLTPETLEKGITPKSRILILNSPSNPTGLMYSADELKALGEVLKRHPDLLILSDDIYNRLVFNAEGLAPHLLHQFPELKDRTLIVNGMSKTYSMTGWRVGWAMGNEKVIAAITNYQSQSTSCIPAFTQLASMEALKNSKNELGEVVRQLKIRRDFIYKAVHQVPGFKALEPEGAFYIWVDIRAYLGRQSKGRLIKDSKAFSEALLEDEKVATVPGVEFGAEGYLRMGYAIQRERMEEALRRIREFVSSFKDL
jgi:aspartate aminotransferase